MRARGRFLIAVTIGACLAYVDPSLGQGQALSETECQTLRQRLAEHAKLSDGVRRALAAQVATSPGGPPAVPAGRTEAIRARLAKIPAERQQLEEQRLGAMVKLEVGRAAQIMEQIQTLDREKKNLETELAALPTAPSAPAPTQPSPPTGSDVDRIRCQDMQAAYGGAIKIRQKELGAREGQPGVVPLAALRGQTSDQIARELAAQFASWPEAATQVGLLDQDGKGRLDATVDVPVQDTFRVFRQRPDGTVNIEVFVLPGRPGGADYGEMARRLDEMTARQAGRPLADILAAQPAGPVRVLGETGDFSKVRAHLLAGNFADAARVEGAAARMTEFQNFRGESVRVLEIIGPVSGGVGIRRLLILPRPNNQEGWEETFTQVRPQSYSRADVEMAISREMRTTTGGVVGARSATSPIRFSLER